MSVQIHHPTRLAPVGIDESPHGAQALEPPRCLPGPLLRGAGEAGRRTEAQGGRGRVSREQEEERRTEVQGAGGGSGGCQRRSGGSRIGSPGEAQ